MAHVEAGATAGGGVPARAHTRTTAGGIETQACHHQEHVTTLGIKSQPATEPRLTPAQELAAGAEILLTHGTDFTQHKADRAGTIISGIMVATMTTATAVGTAYNLVGGSDETLDITRGVSGSHGLVTTHVSRITLYISVRGGYGILQLLLLAASVHGYKQYGKH